MGLAGPYPSFTLDDACPYLIFPLDDIGPNPNSYWITSVQTLFSFGWRRIEPEFTLDDDGPRSGLCCMIRIPTLISVVCWGSQLICGISRVLPLIYVGRQASIPYFLWMTQALTLTHIGCGSKSYFLLDENERIGGKNGESVNFFSRNHKLGGS